MAEDALSQIIEEIASKYLEHYQTQSVKELFNQLISWRPSFKTSLLKVKTNQDVEEIFKEATGILNVNAATGSVELNNALVNAIRSAGFNHADGKITIDGSIISAPRLVTGGGDGATGTTKISGSKLKSKGTQIDVGSNASIEIHGDASIEQN